MLKSVKLQKAVVMKEEILAIEVVVSATVTITMINVHPLASEIDQLLQIHTVKSQSLR